MTSSTLTDRYLTAATRGVPFSLRTEFRRELTERIGDDIDARIEAGISHSDAEYLALSELGSPDLLVASYQDRPAFLIGPRLFPTWKRILRILALTVIPTVAVFLPLGLAIDHKPFGEIIWTTFVALISVAVHLGFWTTLVFARLDRALPDQPITEWKPELLPAAAEPPRNPFRTDFVANLVLIAVFALGIIFHPLFLRFREADGETIPLLNPETWGWLQWYLLAVLAFQLVFWVLLFLRGRWTYGYAAISIVSSLAFAIPTVWAVTNDRLFNHEFLARTGWEDWSQLIGPGGVISIVFAFLFSGLCLMWPIDAFVKARRAHHTT